jgi:hypothetical protein
MGRMTRTLMLSFLVGIVWVGNLPLLCAAPQDTAGANAPAVDGRFRVRTTTIDPDQVVNWEEAQINFNAQDYPFVLQAQTNAAPDLLMSLTGEHINVDGLVYKLKKLSDFAGVYTRTTPEVVKAAGGSDTEAAFRNTQGVVVQITKRPRSEALYLSLLGDSFQILIDRVLGWAGARSVPATEIRCVIDSLSGAVPVEGLQNSIGLLIDGDGRG